MDIHNTSNVGLQFRRGQVGWGVQTTSSLHHTLMETQKNIYNVNVSSLFHPHAANFAV